MRYLMSLILCFFVLFGFVGCASEKDKTPTVGAAETTMTIGIKEANLFYQAWINRDAPVTSVHAIEIQVENASPKIRENVGKPIVFTLINDQGQKQVLHARVSEVVGEQGQNGEALYYCVPLHLRWGKEYIRVINVSLRDYSATPTKMILGQDWLRFVLIDSGKAKAE